MTTRHVKKKQPSYNNDRCQVSNWWLRLNAHGSTDRAARTFVNNVCTALIGGDFTTCTANTNTRCTSIQSWPGLHTGDTSFSLCNCCAAQKCHTHKHKHINKATVAPLKNTTHKHEQSKRCVAQKYNTLAQTHKQSNCCAAQKCHTHTHKHTNKANIALVLQNDA